MTIRQEMAARAERARQIVDQCHGQIVALKPKVTVEIPANEAISAVPLLIAAGIAPIMVGQAIRTLPARRDVGGKWIDIGGIEPVPVYIYTLDLRAKLPTPRAAPSPAMITR